MPALRAYFSGFCLSLNAKLFPAHTKSKLGSRSTSQRAERIVFMSSEMLEFQLNEIKRGLEANQTY